MKITTTLRWAGLNYLEHKQKKNLNVLVKTDWKTMTQIVALKYQWPANPMILFSIRVLSDFFRTLISLLELCWCLILVSWRHTVERGCCRSDICLLHVFIYRNDLQTLGSLAPRNLRNARTWFAFFYLYLNWISCNEPDLWMLKGIRIERPDIFHYIKNLFPIYS